MVFSFTQRSKDSKLILISKSVPKMGFDKFWTSTKEDYQVPLQINEGPDQPTIDFPLVLRPQNHNKEQIIQEIAKIAAQPTDKNEQSKLRQLLDANGGVIHLKGLALEDANDFSEFLDGLAGKGTHAWVPHEHVGMEVLRRPQARNVLNTNERVLLFESRLPANAVSGAHPAILSAGTMNTPSLQPIRITSSSSARSLLDRVEKPPSSTPWHFTIASKKKYQASFKVAGPKVLYTRSLIPSNRWAVSLAATVCIKNPLLVLEMERHYPRLKKASVNTSRSASCKASFPVPLSRPFSPAVLQ